jgi:Ca2+-transporting ATPase
MESLVSVGEFAHLRSVEDVIERLKVDIEHGLSAKQLEERANEFGLNKIPEASEISLWQMLWTQINSIVVYILIVGAVLLFAFQHIIDGVVIVFVILVNVCVGFFMEYKAVSATESLKSLVGQNAQVRRNGERRCVEASSLTLGDVIFLQSGDIAPADARIVYEANLQMVEAMLTGESHPVDKNTIASEETETPLAERKCMVFSGTQVVKGAATCVVTAIGKNCEIGKVGALLSDVKRTKTLLLERLDQFERILSAIIIIIALVTIGIASARGYAIDDAFSVAVGVAVAAIPEGLPACITATFAVGVSYMAKRHAIVKTLPAVETLGSVSVICSDKTGTLTTNQMVVEVMVCGANAQDQVKAATCGVL